MRQIPAVTLLASVLAVAVIAGQIPTPPATLPPVVPPYVASIKRAAPGTPGVRIMMQPGALTTQNALVKMLMRQAFQVQDFQIAGGPDWLDVERFDVSARIEGTPGPGVIPIVLRAILADRFKLITRRETKEMPVYALMVARSDGRLGPQLKPSTMDCATQMAAGRGLPPPGPPAPGERRCGGLGGFGTLTVGGMPLSQFVTQLSQLTGRTVIDRTGLTGTYDFDLTWTPSPDQMPAGAPPPGAPPLPAIDLNGPSLFTALQEQLGLKLESQRGPVEVVVIDRIEQPTED